jgi:beta-lactamase regulating signal transducer with metallopeptidase domain
MSTLFADSPATAALWIVIKASALLGVAAIVQTVLHRRASAATRHLVLSLAIASVLVLPAASLLAPEWTVVVRTVPANEPASPIPPLVEGSPDAGRLSASLDAPSVPLTADAGPVRVEPAAQGLSWMAVTAGVYAAVVVVMLIQLVMQRWKVRRFARLAHGVDAADWVRLFSECATSMGVSRPVRLLRSREHNIPVTFGTRQPSIVIPAIAETWTEDRRQAVLLHELAHVARYDCLTQMLAVAACTVYWFHPAAWWIARQMRIERELACDDRVIAAGTEARDYAGHLLEIAYSFGGHRAPALAVSMARRNQLEGRMLAALDRARNRRVPAFRVRAAVAAAAAALLFSISAFKPTIAAADIDVAAAPQTPAAAGVSPQPAELAAYLKSVEGPLWDSARRLARAAADAMGLQQARLPGTWEIRPTTTEGTVHLRLVELNSSSSTNVPLDRLEGLTAAQLTGAGGPVQFRIRRDAGTFAFEGIIRNGVGAGTFSFTADPNFGAELAKRGFARPTAAEQYEMARSDIGYAFVEELTKQGYSKPQTSELVRAGQHGVHLTYLREMGAIGYRVGSLDSLITLRDHGVTPSYVRDLAQLGYKGLSPDDVRRTRDHGITPEYVKALGDAGYASLPLDELIKTRDHGVTPEYVRGMRDAGYGSLPLKDLVNVRDHGVTPEFVRELGDAGYRKLPLEQVLRVRDHGVTPEYVRDMRQLGYALPPDDLVRARDHGITVEFVRSMATLGYSGLPMESLIRVRDHGVTPEYAQELKALGYDKLALDDLVMLRDHGLTPERIRAANARAGARLPIDLLKSLAAGGLR